MTFALWLAINFGVNLTMARCLPYDVRYEWRNLDAESKGMTLLWYTIPLSWFLIHNPLQASLVWGGVFFFLTGAFLLVWAKRSNPHFQPKLSMPLVIIRTGPYAWVNHPGYWAMILQGLGSVLMLNAPAGAFPLALYGALLAIRAMEEDCLIQKASQLFPNKIVQ